MKSFPVSMWNIQGLNSSRFGYKSEFLEYRENTKHKNIIVLQETWWRSVSVTHCWPNYKEIILSSVKVPNVKTGRDSGGIFIKYNAETSNCIVPIKY